MARHFTKEQASVAIMHRPDKGQQPPSGSPVIFSLLKGRGCCTPALAAPTALKLRDGEICEMREQEKEWLSMERDSILSSM